MSNVGMKLKKMIPNKYKNWYRESIKFEVFTMEMQKK